MMIETRCRIHDGAHATCPRCNACDFECDCTTTEREEFAAAADITSISCCVDCVQLTANGELVDGDGNDIAAAHGAKIEAIWAGYELVIDDLEGSFSWYGCDGCGSRLGGDRYRMAAIKR